MDLPTILDTILSPRTPSEARRFAHEQLELFKTRRDALETCLNLFVQEASSSKRESLLHFALRTCVELLHMKYSSYTPQELSTLKSATFIILSQYAMHLTPLVEAAAISLAVEVLKQDVDHAGFFERLMTGLREPQWSRIACKAINTFSEMLVNEDEENLSQVRRSNLTKFLVSSSPQLFTISLDLIQSALQQQNDPALLVSSLYLASECLRWITPLKTQWERALMLFEASCQELMPPQITCAGFTALKSFVACKTLDLERNGISISKLYESVRRCVILRSTPFRTDQELYDASDVLITAIEKHHGQLPRVTMVQDLEKFTSSGNPFVLSDVLAIWKDLIALNAIELDDGIVNVIMHQSVLCPKSTGDEEEEEDQRGNAVREIVKRRPDLACTCALNLITTCLQNGKWHEAWFLVEAVSNGLSPKHFELFAQPKNAASPAFVTTLEAILDVVFKASMSPPSTVDKLKLVHAAHRIFEVKPNYLAMALEMFVSRALLSHSEEPEPSPKTSSSRRPSSFHVDIRKRAAAFLLLVLRRLRSDKSHGDTGAFISTTILPALVQRVSQAFPTLNGPEKFILLECILVAGKALPSEQDRIQLTREVLNEPFQVLSSFGLEVMSNLLEHRPVGGAPSFSIPWDQRGYFQDVEALPEKSHRVSVALMTLSTCSQDGSLTEDMWNQLLPFAVECLSRLDLIWESWQNPAVQWALLIHPVDARCMLGGRLAESLESFVEGLAEYGETMLKPEKMAVIAFLSSARSCALELLKAACMVSGLTPASLPNTPKSSSSLSNSTIASTKGHLKLVTRQHCERLFRACLIMENRHLAALLSSVPVQEIHPQLFEQLCMHLVERLRNASANPCWRVRVYPGCEPELIEDIEDSARCALELAFTKALRHFVVNQDASTTAPFPDSVVLSLAERLMFGDDASVRLAALTFSERLMTKLPAATLVKVLLRACVTALSTTAKPVTEGSQRVLHDLASETLCRVLFATTIKEYHRVKVTNKKRPSNSPELIEIFGASKVSSFYDEVFLANSEKAFKQSVTDLIQGFALAQKQQQLPGSNASGSLSTQQSQTSQKKQKKKKKKAPRGLKDQNDMMKVNDEDGSKTKSSAGSWHDAVNAKDLGTLLLFNGANDQDDDDL